VEKRTGVLMQLVIAIGIITPAEVPLLQKLLVGVEFAVFAGVVEGNVAVGAFFFGVDFAAVEGLGIDVDADGSLIEFG
jgi:hypothetical protein